LYLILGNIFRKKFHAYLEKIKRRATRFNNTIALGHRQLMLSLYYYYHLKIGRALQHAHKSLSFFKEAEDKDDIVDSLSHITLYLIEQGKFKEASKYLIEAKEIYENIHCEYLKPLLLFSEGSFARLVKQNKCLNILLQALHISKKMGARELTWKIQRELALYHLDRGEIQNTLMYLSDEIDTIKQITESIDNEDIKISYLSVPIRKRAFSEVKLIKQFIEKVC